MARTLGRSGSGAWLVLGEVRRRGRMGREEKGWQPRPPAGKRAPVSLPLTHASRLCAWAMVHALALMPLRPFERPPPMSALMRPCACTSGAGAASCAAPLALLLAPPEVNGGVTHWSVGHGGQQYFSCATFRPLAPAAFYIVTLFS